MNRRGLSVLEAMVAIAILAIAIAPLLEVQRQIARAHQRYDGAYQRMTLRSNAFAVLRDLNPMETPEGRLELAPDVEMRWNAAPISEEVLSTVYPNGDGQFNVALYAVEVEVADKTSGLDNKFSVERMGWRRVVERAVNSRPTDTIDRDRIAYP